jgi:hypothetical protein
MNPSQLDGNLEELQAESVNNGGIFRFVELPINEPVNFENNLQKISHDVKLISIHSDQQKNIIAKQIDYWSMHSGPCPERSENTMKFDILKTKYLKDLFFFLNKENLLNIYQVENLDTWLNDILDSGIDHMNEDFIFQTNNGVYLLHLGFSS